MDDKNAPTDAQERRGAINLIILGVVSVVVAIATTTVSLIIYHYSGDIYLDRSRPGYLPDKAEMEEEDADTRYKIEKSGIMSMEVLEEYIDNLEREARSLDTYDDAFGSEVLSDEHLGIAGDDDTASPEQDGI